LRAGDARPVPRMLPPVCQSSKAGVSSDGGVAPLLAVVTGMLFDSSLISLSNASSGVIRGTLDGAVAAWMSRPICTAGLPS